MTQKQGGDQKPAWLQAHSDPAGVAGSPRGFNDGKLWIGQHAADQDTLVFDPAETDPLGDRLALYSLTQHRKRTFPRSVVLQRIQGLSDDISWRRAKRDYDDRATRRQAHEEVEAASRADRSRRQRDAVLDAHRRHLEGNGIDYRGVAPTPAAHKPGRRTKCHACGIGLDDFASAVCVVCNGVLCSCGTCACARADRSPRVDAS